VGAILLMLSADRVLLGGGVMVRRPFLLPLVRAHVVANLASYLPFLTDDSAARMIAPPALGADAGPLGAIALALAALEGPRP
jgi:fructokinase